MGTSKSEIFTTKDNQIATIAKALSHPARLSILRYLIEKNACVCGDLVLEIQLAQSTISQHLKELKKAGLIKGTISGTSTCYCIDPDNWQKAQNLITQIFTWKPKASCC